MAMFFYALRVNVHRALFIYLNVIANHIVCRTDCVRQWTILFQLTK